MGPFSNNQNTPQTPPDQGNKLPVPDVNSPAQTVLIATGTDMTGTKKWLNVTLIIAAIMALVAVIAFAVYVYISNTPQYMLSAAINNTAHGEGLAGSFVYTTKSAGKNLETSGDFIAYSDPTNTRQGQITVSVGQNAARVSSIARIFNDASYIQTTGLGNLGRLVKAMGGDNSKLTKDKLTQLSGFDNRWYTLTPADVSDVNDVLPQHTVQGNISSTDILTLEELFLKDPFVVFDQQLGDERVNGTNTMHLRLRVDQAKLGTYLQAVRDAHLGAIAVTDGDIKAIRENAELGKIRIEVWISRSDKTFQQAKFIAPNGNDMLVVTLKSEIIATQRQSVIRPGEAQNAAKLVKGLHDLVFAR